MLYFPIDFGELTLDGLVDTGALSSAIAEANLRKTQYLAPQSIVNITVHRRAILLLVVESGTHKILCLSVEGLSVESGAYNVICQFRTVKGMVVESELLKAQNYALSKFSLPMHSNEREFSTQVPINGSKWAVGNSEKHCRTEI